MRKLLALAVGAALAALACGAPASAQTITRSLQASQDATGVFGLDANFNLYIQGNRHLLSSNNNSPPPTAGTCGTAPSVVGTDFAGTITTGSTSTTSCVLTFGTAFAAAPSCTVGGGTALATTAVPLAATTTTTLTVTYAASTSAKIVYICVSTS